MVAVWQTENLSSWIPRWPSSGLPATGAVVSDAAMRARNEPGWRICAPGGGNLPEFGTKSRESTRPPRRLSCHPFLNAGGLGMEPTVRMVGHSKPRRWYDLLRPIIMFQQQAAHFGS